MESTRNAVRAERTRAVLLDTARARFATDGYAATSTPTIVDEAGVSRGALYHHFRDKAHLFEAVVEREYAAVAEVIEAIAAATMEQTVDSVEILVAAGNAFLDALRDPGRRRILLVDGPAVLGPETIHEINGRHTGRTLRMGVAAAVACGDFADLPIDAVADVLDAAYDRTALVEGDDAPHRMVIGIMMEGFRRGKMTAGNATSREHP